MVNSIAFHNELTPAKAYWLGVLASDGEVKQQTQGKCINWLVKLEWKESDKQGVFNFTDFVQGNQPIQRKGQRSSWIAQVCSAVMAHRLIQLGITPKKSLELKVDESLTQSWDFWRGVFDGDGCISFMNNPGRTVQVRIRSFSPDFLAQLKDSFPLFKISKMGDDAYLYGDNAIAFLNLIYAGSTPKTRLARKYRLASPYLDCTRD